MELEKEKGITIKLASIRLKWKECILNLIDTPGHIDFSAEVLRSLKVCEGAILLIDVTKGVQSQTVSLFKKAREEGLYILPVLNKIDSPLATDARIEEVRGLLEDSPYNFSHFQLISARTGRGVKDLLDYIVEKLPEHSDNRYLEKLNLPFIQAGGLCALVFEAQYSNQKGTILTIRVFSGEIKKNDEIYLVKTGVKVRVREIEFLSPRPQTTDRILQGEVGRIYLFLPKKVYLESGEHIVSYPPPKDSELKLLPDTHRMGRLKPMIFSFIAPFEESGREAFSTSLKSLKLSDSSFEYSFTQSSSLGFGANIGALGPLHLEVLISRLEGEFGLKLMSGPSTIEYKAQLKSGQEITFSSVDSFPDPSLVKEFLEPYIHLSLSLSPRYEKDFISFISSRRSVSLLSIKREEEQNLFLEYLLPLGELNSSFVHSLFAITKGYISYSYELGEYYSLDLLKIGIFINDVEYSELSFLSEKGEAYTRGREILLKLKNNLSAQLYELVLHAKIGGKIIARESVRSLKKDVAAKCYGGDISRKKKL
ncbi:hypothetical protein PVNG_02362 [Plasmodium vivax North Korean]|uniref:Tr-type G domain-containing protein n=1 Tax=Plasmodium vivax North Korean TaxID=1035514 RepID=A0A0J9TLN0_PLAVI|nr:hypothetical protein PVNG_02362 [Plasmodium vivax North Korean]